MKLLCLRFNNALDSTNGMLFYEGFTGYDFLCYTLEDEYRIDKVMGETSKYDWVIEGVEKKDA